MNSEAKWLVRKRRGICKCGWMMSLTPTEGLQLIYLFATLLDMNDHIAWTYIMTNKTRTTLYVGSTVNISTRMWEHQTKRSPNSFTARYKIDKLVYYRGFHSVESARTEEQYIKGKSRDWKLTLINSINPDWNDLTDQARRE